MTTAEIPTKVQRFITSAQRKDLIVEEAQGFPTTRVWEIRNPHNRYDDLLWIYWTPGPRSGRLNLVRYSTITHKVTRVSRPGAYDTIASMAYRPEGSAP